MTPAEKAEYVRIAAERDHRRSARPARSSLAEFSRRGWHLLEPKRPFVPGWHIDAIAEHLEAVVRGEIRNLIINIPPRHMKSLLIGVFFNAWVWIDLPEKRFLYSSYAQNLSTRDAVKTRRLIESPWYRNEFRIDWSLAGDQNQKTRFMNTREGYRIATSVGGSGTGEGGDFLVVDDPHKAGDIHSDTKRNTVIEWWDEEMSTRANDPKSFSRIIVMQRLHEADLSGHCLAKESGWEHLCLPAEYEGSRARVTSIGWEDPRRKEGELLWPARFGAEELAALKIDLGSQGVAGQLQQRPAPAEGNIVKDHWWRFWKVLPDDLTGWMQSWDLSFDATDNSSYVVGQVWACRGADRYLVHQWRERVKFTGQLGAVRLVSAAYPLTGVKLVEKKANGAALIDTLNKEIQGIVPVEPRGSKQARAESVTPQIEAGNVYLPDPSICPWVGDYLLEWKVFPNGKNDDQVDATSQALTRLKQGAGVFTPVSLTGASKWLGK